MKRVFSIMTVVLLVLAVAAQAVSAAPLVPVATGGKAAAAQADWEIGEITFAAGVEDDGTPIGPDVTFEEGIANIYAIFDFTGLVSDDLLTAVWYQDDEEALVQEFTLEEIYDSTDIPDEGAIWFYADFSNAAAATYVVELYVNDDFAVDGTFVVVPQGEVGPVAPTGGAGVVSLSQEIPIVITIPHPDDPSSVITVPVTLTVDLQITLGSNPEVTIEVGEATDLDGGLGDLTEEELTYVLTVTDYMSAYGETLTTLGGLLTEVGEDESLLEDEEWLDAVYAELDTLIATSDEVRALEAPAGFEDVQEQMNTAADHFESAAFLLDDAIQSGDEGVVDEALEEITLGGEALSAAADLIGGMDIDTGEGSSSLNLDILNKKSG